MFTKICIIELTRDLICFKFVVTDFSPKLLAPVLAKTLVTHRSPCYSAVSALLINPLPDRSNYSPLCHTHYQIPDQSFTSLFGPDTLPTFKVHCCSALLQNLVGNSVPWGSWTTSRGKCRCSLQIVNSVPFCYFSLCLYPLSAPLPHPFFLLWSILCLPKIKTSSVITFCFTNGTFFCILFHTMTYFLIMLSISL